MVLSVCWMRKRETVGYNVHVYEINKPSFFPEVRLFFFCICSEKNVPVFHLNYEKKDLALWVRVNNMNGDDAYEAKLVGTFPDVASYSGVRSQQPTVNRTSSVELQ